MPRGAAVFKNKQMTRLRVYVLGTESEIRVRIRDLVEGLHYMNGVVLWWLIAVLELQQLLYSTTKNKKEEVVVKARVE